MTMATAAPRRAAILAVASWDRPDVNIGLDDPWQFAVSRSFVHDVISVLLLSPLIHDIFVVTSDAAVRTDLAPWDVTFVDDPGRGVDAALRSGRDHVVAGGSHDHVLILGRDLPCITTDGIEALCESAAAHRHAFCPDVDVRFPSVILSADPSTLPIITGAGASTALRTSGVALIDDADRCMRRGVRSRQHLFEVDRLGVGSHTRATLLELGRAMARIGTRPASRRRATAS